MTFSGDDEKTLVNQYVLDSYNGVTNKLNARADELIGLAADLRRIVQDTRDTAALSREEVRHVREFSESLREKVALLRSRVKWVLATCALLVAFEGYTLFWRAKGRDIQYKILETCSECSRSG